MNVGFTGTQRGMTREQKETLDTFLSEECGEFHHGDCIGADAEAHEIALRLGYSVVIHPPINSSKRAFCAYAAQTRIAAQYLDRNKDIVIASQVLIATPGEKEEQLRSGTWSTVRYAKALRKNVVLIFPDGTTQ